MKSIDYYHLGTKIRAKRHEYGYTQEKLAELCDISTGFLGHIENGTRVLSLETLYSIACVLHVSIDYLLLDSAVDPDNFMEQIISAVQIKNPQKYNQFRKTVKILADHIDEL